MQFKTWGWIFHLINFTGHGKWDWHVTPSHTTMMNARYTSLTAIWDRFGLGTTHTGLVVVVLCPPLPLWRDRDRNVIWSKSDVVWKKNSLETCPGGYQPGVGLDHLPEWVLLLLQFCFSHRAGLQQRNTEDKKMPLFLECMHCSFICAVALFSMYSHSSSAPPLRSCLEATSQL